MAALAFIGHKLAGDLLAPRQFSVLAARIQHPSQGHSRTDLSERQAEMSAACQRVGSPPFAPLSA
jgi:hypothetical protein